MWKVLIGAAVGLVIGGAVGYGMASLMAPAPPIQQEGWTSYPTIASPVIWQHILRTDPEPRYFYFTGMLLGGGFGALIGAVAAAVRTVVQELRKAGRSA
jgi:hypothetical protein